VSALTYQLIVEGDLDDELKLAFEGFTFTHAAGTTTLTGLIRDQAELQGLLQHVSSLGLTLIELTEIDDAERPVPPNGRRRPHRRPRAGSLPH
jgi:hypothetical protein